MTFQDLEKMLFLKKQANFNGHAMRSTAKVSQAV
jgi:hypothetical protein